MLKNKTAFTMLEAIMVIVVMGIIAAVAIPRLENDSLQEASDQILSDIRYTQHLALTDDVTNPNNANWQTAFWGINFGTCTGGRPSYSITSDKNYDGASVVGEAAIDQLSGNPIFGNGVACEDSATSQRSFIGDKYGITSLLFAGSCNATTLVGFDRLGRLHVGYTGANNDYATYATALPCTITFTRNDGASFIIQINPETGYAFRTDQPNM